MNSKMRKYLWAIIAAVCLLAVVVAGAIFIPRIFSSSHVEDSMEMVTPGHWWQTDLNEQQLKTLQTLWGSEVTIEEFVIALWPEAMKELPGEAAQLWEQRKVYWPMEEFEDWEQGAFQTMCFGLGATGDGGTTKCFDVYLGNRALETTTLLRSKDSGLVEDSCYRVSMYTDGVIQHQPMLPT